MSLPLEHDCPWREEAERLSSQLDDVKQELRGVKAELQALKRQVFGKKSERVVPVERELRKERPPDREATQRARAEQAARKEQMATEVVEHRVAPEQRVCPACGPAAAPPKPVGAGKESVEYEYVPGYFRRRLHRRETLACACGKYIVTASAPERVTDKTAYGPGFLAHLITSKCADSIPIYRLEKHYERTGIPIARSTMNDLLHRSAELLEPLARRLLARIAAADVVLADETSHRLQTTTKRPYLWVFTDGQRVAYRFSSNRSGETPAQVLGGTAGTLVVDAYTGYNRVTSVGGRERAGCMAHARRKFYEALATAPEAQTALDWIRGLYRIEHEAFERRVVRTPEHLAMRQSRGRPILDELHSWLVEQKEMHLPKGPMGHAVAYALKNWQALTRFLQDAAIPIDNNASERALRVIALGRKNYLFFGHERAGKNFAVLYSLVASCEAAGINPLDYLTDVLMRIQTHPIERIDELLPDRWVPHRHARPPDT